MSSNTSQSASLRLDILLACLTATVFVILTMVWFSFDLHIPSADEGGHILRSIDFGELLSRCRLWQSHWWYQCLTFSSFYPPFIYLINSLFLRLFGESRIVEQGYMSAFTGLMVISLYAVVRLLNGGRIAACLAGLIIAAYPLISWLSHSFFLDLPAASMLAFALMILLWWKSYPNPNLFRTIAAGIALGTACLSKQMIPAYIVPVWVYFLIIDLVRAYRSNADDSDRFKSLIHTLGLFIIAAPLNLAFWACSYKTYKNWLGYNVQTFANAGVHHSFFGNLSFYLHLLLLGMTPALFLLFVLALLFLRHNEYQNLLPIIISMIGGLCLTCTCMGTDLDFRYIVPFLIGSAIFSAFLIDKLIRSSNMIQRICGFFLVALVISTYLSYNFFLYPIPLPKLPWAIGFGGHENGNPNQHGYTDWGYPLVLKTITEVDKGKPVFLSILPNHDSLHVSSFQLFLREQGNNTIYPTNPRTWSIVGDRVTFDPATACYPMWYLLKTGDNGFRLADKQSMVAYAQLIDFIGNSGNFKLISRKVLPDQSELLLYRRAI